MLLSLWLLLWLRLLFVAEAALNAVGAVVVALAVVVVVPAEAAVVVVVAAAVVEAALNVVGAVVPVGVAAAVAGRLLTL